jgi:hypothetical protein
MAALTNLSTATIIKWWEGQIYHPASAPSGATYASVLDGAQLVYSDALGNRGTLLIPAPTNAMFLADQESVDMTWPGLGGLLTAMDTELIVEGSGLPIATFIGGRRRAYRANLGI